MKLRKFRIDAGYKFCKNGRLWSMKQMIIVSGMITIALLYIALFRTQQSNYVLPEAKHVRNVFARGHDSLYQPNELGVCTGPRWDESVTPIYIITPTYPRAEQIPELTRLGQTLLLIDSLVWIVAEDSETPSNNVKQFLRESGHCFVYLHAPMPSKFKKNKVKPRGVANRNAGLNWIYENAGKGGVVYFADDDNTYDRRLFEEIRTTRKVSMFPVGLVTSYSLSTPIVRNKTVVDFYDGWLAHRRFPVDMAGFAFNVNFYKSFSSPVQMPFLPGREETLFLEGLKISNSDIEPLADDCTKILVWHTRTQKNKEANLKTDINYKNSNVDKLRELLWKGSGQIKKK